MKDIPSQEWISLTPVDLAENEDNALADSLAASSLTLDPIACMRAVSRRGVDSRACLGASFLARASIT